ncbi:MAG TPA: hypothetical protein VGP72_09930 [Planctomycetota bacterium]|jgi:hypothetical protein
MKVGISYGMIAAVLCAVIFSAANSAADEGKATTETVKLKVSGMG